MKRICNYTFKMSLTFIYKSKLVPRQELTEQRHSGSNPDYGLPTPTLVSPPKGLKHSAQPKMGGMAPSNLEIALFKQYPFDSAVQRMTVVAKKKGAQYYSVFIKGAPEKVASFCRSETSKTKVLLTQMIVS